MQRDFALKASVLHDVLGIGVSGQSADASVLRQISERNIQAEIFARKLVNRRTARQSPPIRIGSEKELVKIFCDRHSDFFNLFVRLNHLAPSFASTNHFVPS